MKLHKDVLKKVDGIFIRNSDENRVRPSPGLVRDLNGRTHPSGAVLPSNAVDVDSSDSDDHSQFTLIRTNTSVVEMFWEVSVLCCWIRTHARTHARTHTPV